MEYSPGPWEARYEDLAYTIYAADEYDIALVACYPAELEQANALLIAAAPDLLEAAKEILLAGFDDSGSNMDSVIYAEQLLRKAIAKAEGREENA